MAQSSGWAGFKLMRDLDKYHYDITVVSPRNYFVFTPLLASTSVGTLEFRCITEPVRGYSKDITYHQAWCDKIDLKNQIIQCTSNLEDSYDKLVISVGEYSNTFNIPGVKEHAIFLKDIKDAKRIRSRVLECFEYAAQPNVSRQEKVNKLHFAVVGGGPTGVEFSAELYDFIKENLSRLYPDLMQYIQMTVYDVSSHILGSFDEKLSAYATRKFERRGIKIKPGSHVLEVKDGILNIKEEGEVPFGMLVWSTGLMSNPVVEAMTDVAKHTRTHRYALGDCATIENCDLPATAQELNNAAHSLPTKKEFKFANRGSMAYIGSWEAVVDMTPVHKKASEGGHMAWLFWRSAYLSMSVSPRNKMLIPMYWVLTWVFGRDVSRL
ncbi:pyridine nucleotide-disulfide oxidoreductase-domain-containing protein [Spinellus fusiger]|nr:pyridine nucleotide-disulfide oxidoreductase-domain-containing protein [Spinellus fusiger]